MCGLVLNIKIRGRSDFNGKRLKVGDRVRVCAVPDLSGMSIEGIRESRPVFKYAVGKIFQIQGFDRYGYAELFFSIPFGKDRGMHGIVVEPALLKKVKKTLC